MTQVTDRSRPLSSDSAGDRGKAAALAVALLRGAIAAGLGLGAVAVLVTALWISSPYPDGGADGAFHVAAALWLLAHGAELVRADGLGGGPSPIGVVPLLLVALPVGLAYRAARDTLVPVEGRPQLTALGALSTVSCGYLMVAAAVLVYARGGPLAVSPFGGLCMLLVVTLATTTAGAWAGSGRPIGPLRLLPPAMLRTDLVRAVWEAAQRPRSAAALRAAVAAVTVLLGGGALLVAISLGRHADLAQESFLRLAEDWSGRVGALLLGLALLPNAAVWGAAYALGPGFALGTASTVTPFGVSGHAVAPDFPLLAAVPEGHGTPLNWATAAIPALSALVVAWFTARAAAPPHVRRDDAWTSRGTVATVALAGVLTGAGTATLAAIAGGPMGHGNLADFGPVWWLSGAAALCWTVVVGVPAVLLLRVWRLRGQPGDSGPGDSGPAAAGPAAAASPVRRRAWWHASWYAPGRLMSGSRSHGHPYNGIDDRPSSGKPGRADEAGHPGAPEPDGDYDVLPVGVRHEPGAREGVSSTIEAASGEPVLSAEPHSAPPDPDPDTSPDPGKPTPASARPEPPERTDPSEQADPSGNAAASGNAARSASTAGSERAALSEPSREPLPFTGDEG